jgi:hypothetical protein
MIQSNLEDRGYRLLFRAQGTNSCPGCGRSHWHVGRTTAECAFCATALPIAENYRVVLAHGRDPAIAA